VIPDTPRTPVPLTTLAAGASARLQATRLDDDTRSLLRSLGLTDASHVRVCKCGDPFIIQVRTTRIGLSSSVAGKIYVVLDSEPRHASEHGRHRSNS
jgi:Fe2+ transport system protein FeoA